MSSDPAGSALPLRPEERALALELDAYGSALTEVSSTLEPAVPGVAPTLPARDSLGVAPG